MENNDIKESSVEKAMLKKIDQRIQVTKGKIRDYGWDKGVSPYDVIAWCHEIIAFEEAQTIIQEAIKQQSKEEQQ